MTAARANPLSLFDVRGKVAIVTGASGAFGALAAEVLAAAGAKLVLAAGKAKELEEIAATCRDIGAEVEPVNGRPANEADCEWIVEAAKLRFGRVDILVVASGKNDVAKIVDMAPERFLDVMDANVTQSWLMARAVGKQMLAQGEGGKIVLMSSARGLLGHPAGYTAYCASKAAIDGITRRWAANGGRLASPSMRSPRRCSARRSPPGCLTTTSGPRRRGQAFSPACRRGGSANRTISRDRCCSSHPGPPTSTPAISSTPTAATRRDDDDALQRIAILGGGLMGHGIAQVFAAAGHRVQDHRSERRSARSRSLRAHRAQTWTISALIAPRWLGSRSSTRSSAASPARTGCSKRRPNSSSSSSRSSRRSSAPRRPTQYSPRTPPSFRSARSCPESSAGIARLARTGGTRPISCRWSK